MKYINIFKITDINNDVFVGSTHSNDLSGLYKRFQKADRLFERLWQEDMLTRREIYERMPYKDNFYLINKVLQSQDTTSIKLIECFEYMDKSELIDRMDYHFKATPGCINISGAYHNPLTDDEDDKFFNTQ
jgi:hypothetical protein